LNFPKTAGRPLSDGRIREFTEGAQETFKWNCNARLILNKVAPRTEGGFHKIGINHIVDRIWFVDGPFEGSDMAYGTPSGADYGMTIAERESREVLEDVFALLRTNTARYVTEVTKDLEENEIHQFLDGLQTIQINPTAIVASIDQSTRFWFFKSFLASREPRKGLVSPEGSFHGVPVFYSRLLPDGSILCVDRNALGTLEVKSDFGIWVSDINDPQDRASVRKALPGLADADLNEKVRILCHEVVKATIHHVEPGASFHIIARKGTELKLNVFSG
jgi:hypothetical protein